MNQNSFLKEITEAFPEIKCGTAQEYAGEIHLHADPAAIPSLCNYFFQVKEGELISLFAADETGTFGGFALYYAFSIKKEGCLLLLKTNLAPGETSFQSISNTIYAALRYEREIADLFGIIPVGHPAPHPLVHHANWPKGQYPLRKSFDRSFKPPFANREIPFTKVEGTGVFEVPVGPVHAGIIEPGHFRFSVAGEPIINLEAQLYYVHKGIEKLCEDKTLENVLFFSERISGDETFANSLAYCIAVEKICGTVLPQRAEFSRVIFAELERLLRHLGDLGGICTDVAYGFAASSFQMLQNWAYQIIEEITGSRFLRSVNQPGGLRRDFLTDKESRLLESIQQIETELTDTVGIIKAQNTFIDRVEHTGVLKEIIAADLHAVGPAARASGICRDVRKDFPYSVYDKFEFSVPQHANGDVNCRMNVKIEECFESIHIIRQAVAALPSGEFKTIVASPAPGNSALACVEAPRGESVHFVAAGENGTIARYKIRTPSFCNWPALCYAVKGNIIPDFPLINKSFNLSYAGNDL